MPRRTANTRANPSPHFDSHQDSVIKDATGKEIGVREDFQNTKNTQFENNLKHEGENRAEKNSINDNS